MNKTLIVCGLIAAALLLVGCNKEYKLTLQPHTVRSGETLWSVASKYHSRQDKFRDVRELIWHIREVNQLDPQRFLQPGDVVKVPLWVAQ